MRLGDVMGYEIFSTKSNCHFWSDMETTTIMARLCVVRGGGTFNKRQ